MPVAIKIDWEFNLPLGEVETGAERLTAMLSPAQRRLKVGSLRKWKLFKTRLLEMVDQVRPKDDERPILKKNGKILEFLLHNFSDTIVLRASCSL